MKKLNSFSMLVWLLYNIIKWLEQHFNLLQVIIVVLVAQLGIVYISGACVTSMQLLITFISKCCKYSCFLLCYLWFLKYEVPEEIKILNFTSDYYLFWPWNKEFTLKCWIYSSIPELISNLITLTMLKWQTDVTLLQLKRGNG